MCRAFEPHPDFLTKGFEPSPLMKFIFLSLTSFDAYPRLLVRHRPTIDEQCGTRETSVIAQYPRYGTYVEGRAISLMLIFGGHFDCQSTLALIHPAMSCAQVLPVHIALRRACRSLPRLEPPSSRGCIIVKSRPHRRSTDVSSTVRTAINPL